jgi:hypothetical protein
MDQVGFRRIVFHDQEAQALAHLVTPLGGGLKKEKPKFRDGLEPAFNVPARRFGTRSNDTPIARSASTTTARTTFSQFGKEFTATHDDQYQTYHTPIGIPKKNYVFEQGELR